MDTRDIVRIAEKATGLQASEGSSYWEGVDLLVAEANASTRLSEAGRAKLEQIYINEVSNRLKIDDYIAQHPEVLEAPVESPIFVFGIPRTGTTLTSYLLGADPALRPLLNWEAVDAVPPPTTETLRTDPRAIAKAKLKAQMLVEDPARGRYHWEAADGPTECVFVHSQDARSGFLESSFPMPRYTKWWQDGDQASAYHHQKRVLQVLQSQAPGQWSLKAPSHALFLDHLVSVFPNAILVWMHRDPLPTVSSYASLIRRNQTNYCDEVDTDYIGRNALSSAVKHATRPSEFRDRVGFDRVHDVSYANLVRNPIEEMSKLYEHMGSTLSGTAVDGMQAWLHDNPQNKHGKHQYRPEEFGLTTDQIRNELADYVKRYTIEEEV